MAALERMRRLRNTFAAASAGVFGAMLGAAAGTFLALIVSWLIGLRPEWNHIGILVAGPILATFLAFLTGIAIALPIFCALIALRWEHPLMCLAIGVGCSGALLDGSPFHWSYEAWVAAFAGACGGITAWYAIRSTLRENPVSP